MSEHTPGPWDYVFDVSYTSGQYPEPDYEYARISSNKRFNIATIYPDSEEWRANARLIAAAPQLLEACEAALNNIDLNVYDCDKIERELSEAIAAAKGES